jgi:hypothetical protein
MLVKSRAKIKFGYCSTLFERKFAFRQAGVFLLPEFGLLLLLQ